MPFDPAPSTLLGENYAADSNTVTLTIADFPELLAAEANASTGDVRKLLFALVDKIATDFAALPSGDKPTKMTITKQTGPLTNSLTTRVNYSFSFEIAVADPEVRAE